MRGSPGLGHGRLTWRIGLFQTDNHNDILALASVIQGRGYYANVPQTRRRGIEASLDYRAARWSAYAGYSHIEATYRFTGQLPSPNNPFAVDGEITVAPGDRIGGIPADRFKAGAEVELYPAFTMGADVIAVGDQFLVGDEANQDKALPGYWVAGVHAAWRLRRGLELVGRIENLFDHGHATYGSYFETEALDNLEPSPLPADPDPRTFTPAPPRAFLLGLRVRW